MEAWAVRTCSDKDPKSVPEPSRWAEKGIGIAKENRGPKEVEGDRAVVAAGAEGLRFLCPFG